MLWIFIHQCGLVYIYSVSDKKQKMWFSLSYFYLDKLRIASPYSSIIFLAYYEAVHAFCILVPGEAKCSLQIFVSCTLK